jgi:hypothetical protein
MCHSPQTPRLDSAYTTASFYMSDGGSGGDGTSPPALLAYESASARLGITHFDTPTKT